MTENAIYLLRGNNQETELYYFNKEYRDDIIVKLGEFYYELYFFTQDSLEYEMTNDGFFAFPGLIILDNISFQNIKIAILKLQKVGYFKRLKGERVLAQEKRFVHSWYQNELSLFNEEDLKIEKI